jgi:PEGA domain-containing protein
MVDGTHLCYRRRFMGAGVGHSSGGDEDYTPLIPQVRVRIGVECATVGEFVERYCRFVDGDRIFIATEAVEAAGSLVQFRVDLSDGRAAVHGTGTVIESHSDTQKGMPRGMLLRFVALDEASARVVEAMGVRRARSTPTFGVPSVDKAQTWHTQSVERELVLPANPFGDVSEAALAYFVDWSIERNGSLSLRRGPAAVAFHAVRMEAPRRRRRRPPSWVPFVIGLATGGVGIFAVIHATQEFDRALWTRHPAPMVAASATTTTTTTTTAQPPAPSRHTEPIVAALPAKPAATAPTSAVLPPKPPTPAARAPATSDDAATLSIAAEPGAAVSVDGRRVGHTPLTLPVARGAHVVELSRPRYETARIDVEAPGRASGQLERPRATVHVTSNVADAEVLVEGESVGRAPVSAEVAGYERCRIEVRAPGGRTWKKRVYVKPPLTDLAATFAGE